MYMYLFNVGQFNIMLHGVVHCCDAVLIDNLQNSRKEIYHNSKTIAAG